MKSILFVDDEPNILQGLQRMLRPMCREWDMAFVGSGQEALNLLVDHPFDIIVSDMRMPGMDGATLLSRVMERYPHTVRLALSGQSDKETIFRSVGPTHQFLAKPCDAETLKAVVTRAFALRELLGSEKLKRLISQLDVLPMLPEVYTMLMEELESPDASVAGVARIIEGDVAMTAKLLQYVNSAFFGIRQRVSSMTQAVSLLGLDVVRSLVLMVAVFSQAAASRLPQRFSFDTFGHHSLAVGAFARSISKRMCQDDKDIGDSFTAGLLHDVGMLVLASNVPGEYGEVLAKPAAEGITLEEAEKDAFGASHAQVGAYLVGLWGFADPVVEAIAFHPEPQVCLARSFSSLVAVYTANAFAEFLEAPAEVATQPALDWDYLRECGVAAHVPEWQIACCTKREEAP